MSLESVLLDFGAHEVSAMDVYSDVFMLSTGFIQREGEEPGRHKANPIVLGSFDGRMRRRILFEDTFEETINEFQKADWAITNGLTYWGRANTAEAQSKMCAMIFDLDGQDDGTLRNLLYNCRSDYPIYPEPNYVILSGHNVHLYYVLEEPADLYPNTKSLLKDMKYHLTDRIWNRYTSHIEKPQHQGINQGFRVIGGKTKDGGTVRAFKVNEHPFSLDELNAVLPEEQRVDLTKRWRQTRYTLDQAKEKFPEWYERVVENGEPRRVWYQKRDLYEWWLRKCLNPHVEEGNIDGRHFSNVGVAYGHRYFCVMALVIFAVKCGITDRDEVKADAMTLLPLFNRINPDAPFTERDVDSALECLDLRYIRFPRKDLERITAIAMPPNKRNGRKQEQHMEYLNGLRKMRRDILGEDEYRNVGRPKGSGTKRDAVLAYRASHPDASQREIAAALGMSKTTVNKWLKEAR